MKTESASKNKKRAKDCERTLYAWAIGFIVIILGVTIRGDYFVSVQELSAVAFLLMAIAVILHMLRKHAEERDLCPGMLARPELDA